MADSKKYYYLKLKENFYDSEEMIILQNMQDGYLYSDILMKLYLRSLKTDGKLMFNNVIPYTPEILAQVVRHQVGTVEMALKIFHQLGLIEILDNGTIFMLDIQNFIGKSSTEADRKRQYREQIAKEKQLLISDSGQMSRQTGDNPPPEIEIEKELELELKKENKLNDFNLFNNFDQNLQCDCIANSTNKRCERKSSFNINGKNYCNQHARDLIPDLKISKVSKKFIKPTIKQIDDYCQERKNNVRPEEFYDFYESKGWKVGKSPMKDWKACVRTWERRDKEKETNYERNKRLIDEYFGKDDELD